MITSNYYKIPHFLYFSIPQHQKPEMDMKLNIKWVVGVVHFPCAIPSREFKIIVYTPIEDVRKPFQ